MVYHPRHRNLQISDPTVTARMSSNVGLSTPRGSGTSGYVQRNLSHIRPRDPNNSYNPKDHDKFQRHQQRQPDKGILEHDRKRNVEVKCLELQDKLEDEGMAEDEIEERVAALRKTLMGQLDAQGVDAKGLKAHQVHELAQAKMAENARLQRALQISADYEEGSHWKRQAEEKARRAEENTAKEVLAQQERERQKLRQIEEELRREKERDAALRRRNRRDRSDSRSRSRSPSRSRSRSRGGAAGGRRVERDSRSRSRSRGSSYDSRSRSRSRSRSGSVDRRRRSVSDSRSRSRSRSYSADRERRRYSDRE
ncbi:Pre-mRNA-splicing factor [Drechslerella dactyloides]|uniref:Pre-mRNA-splicing factor n=1 Tax=Drechslerella dactyloides TaxID=74499 RepID=A0AAD6J6G5_DREDA|nr:Pre-mRNA-splicing factor [Drechslerella dactyloides]